MAAAAKEERQPVVVKRYQNRRLYDTGSSRYVNLEDLAEMVRQGHRIQVVDAKSGEDLTRRFLSQILIESQTLFPIELLHQLAGASDRAFREFLQWYMAGALEVYQRVRGAWQENVFRRLGAAPRSLDAWTQMWDPRNVASSLTRAWGLAPPGAGDEVEDPGDDVEAADDEDEGASAQEEIELLRRRLEKLEERLASAEDADA